MAISAEKQQLRAVLRSRRAALAAAQPGHAAALAGFAVEPVFATAAVIAGYWPLPGEADVLPLLAALHQRGHALALPRMVGPQHGLAFHAWEPGAALARGAYGIAEPLAAAPLAVPDLVLVPLLGFDRAGRRLGYGGGFYDRTLAAARAERPTRVIGIAFAGQELENLPEEPFDQRLDGMLTERGLIRCGGVDPG